jgi:hypothetical protein
MLIASRRDIAEKEVMNFNIDAVKLDASVGVSANGLVK